SILDTMVHITTQSIMDGLSRNIDDMQCGDVLPRIFREQHKLIQKVFTYGIRSKSVRTSLIAVQRSLLSIQKSCNKLLPLESVIHAMASA
ncbi:hypothetical protein PMAYCL1PPCAC_21648, partial [Pristionchus mayeri]